MNVQTTTQQDIFAKDISDKGLVPRIPNEPPGLNKMTNNPINKWDKDTNHHILYDSLSIKYLQYLIHRDTTHNGGYQGVGGVRNRV